MPIRLKRETSITLDAADMHAILTNQLCDYGAFGGLEVYAVNSNDDNTFLVTMMPKPEEPKSGQPS